MFPIKDDQPLYSTPYVNFFLIGLNILIFLFQWLQWTTDPRAADDSHEFTAKFRRIWRRSWLAPKSILYPQ